MTTTTTLNRKVKAIVLCACVLLVVVISSIVKSSSSVSFNNFKPITQEQAQQVEKFVFFTGYPRSGHSIVGSLLDAHPDISLSRAFYLFRKLLEHHASFETLLQNKTLFYNVLFETSYDYSKVDVAKILRNKGYSLDVPGLWSGKFNKLRIIGDKSGPATTQVYSSYSPTWFKERYGHLRKSVGVPLVGIHVVRNPFDMIATHMLYMLQHFWKKEQSDVRTDNPAMLRETVDLYFNMANAVKEMIPLCNMTVLEVHTENLVHSPRKEMERACKFLEVDCSENYLTGCENKIYKSISRTRDKVVWPSDIRALVEERIKEYPFFRGYTFEEDSYNNPLGLSIP